MNGCVALAGEIAFNVKVLPMLGAIELQKPNSKLF